MKSLTLNGGFGTLQAIGRSEQSLGIQLSFQALVLVPVPIRRISPWAKNSLPSTIERQTLDG
jgi:hypothetical protein